MLSSTCLSSPRPSASRIAISCRPARGADRWTCAKGKPCVAFAVSRPEGWLFVGDGDHRLVQQVGNCHGPVTIWACAADADPAGEGAAGLAALFTQESVAAVGAFVDGDFAAAPDFRDGDDGTGLLMAAAERGLAAGGAAVRLPADRGEDWWQTGHGVVPSSSRDGVRSGGVLVGAGTVTGHVPCGEVWLVVSVRRASRMR